jgi:transcriptional regulator with XRE-family HTH domain
MKLRLRAVRERSLLTQQEVAERAALGVATISRLERGGEARLRTVRKLAAALDVDQSELIVRADRRQS